MEYQKRNYQNFSKEGEVVMADIDFRIEFVVCDECEKSIEVNHFTHLENYRDTCKFCGVKCGSRRKRGNLIQFHIEEFVIYYASKLITFEKLLKDTIKKLEEKFDD